MFLLFISLLSIHTVNIGDIYAANLKKKHLFKLYEDEFIFTAVTVVNYLIVILSLGPPN